MAAAAVDRFSFEDLGPVGSDGLLADPLACPGRNPAP
jgi:hypothetical protein